MMNIEKMIAGVTVGVGSIALIITGNVDIGAVLLSGMMGFFIGDQNGNKEATKALSKALEANTAKHDEDIHNLQQSKQNKS